MVVFYHLIYDLDMLGGYRIASTSGFWAVFADASAFAFVFLAGLSLALSRARATPGRHGGAFPEYLRRGARIFLYGMLVTLVFWVLDLGAVVFGILHLIGASIVLAYPFLRLKLANLLLGLLLVAAGVYVLSQGLYTEGVWLAPLGIRPEGLYMPDYRPLLPWFGVVLFGLYFGNAAYLPRRAKAKPAPPYAVPLAFLGRHTLLIYLVHQPVLISVLWTLGVVDL